MSDPEKNDRPNGGPDQSAPPKRLTVTALIPTYNMAHFVRQAVDSVLAQSRPVDEVIVVDDGSTDNTAEVLAPYEGRLRRVLKKNGGLASARNAGLREAKGDFIALLDADDLWQPDKMEKQMGFLAQHPGIDFLFGDYCNFSDETDNEEPEIKCPAMHDYLVANASNLTQIFDCLLEENVVLPSTVVFRWSCLERTGYFDEKLRRVEDLDLWLRAARVCRFGFVNAMVTKRRRHGANLTNQWAKMQMVHADVLANALNTLTDLTEKSKKLMKARIAGLHYDLGSYFLKQRDFAMAYQYLRQMDGGTADPRWLVKWMVASVLRKIPMLAKSASA
jgi:glycosyltransferase involved in cell wall biosynthesis